MTELKKVSKQNKITYLIIGIIFIMMLSVGIPSLARFKNRITFDVNVWDGSIASSYKSGTGESSDPYVISNGSELAYFFENLKSNNYENKYFVLSNDIILNKGSFKYENNQIVYTLDNVDYYVKDDIYYDSIDFTNKVGSVNTFNSLDNFKGTIDFDSYTIYGLYLNKENASFFTNLEGNISNLYLKNTLLIGEQTGVIDKAINSNIENILFEGYMISNKNILSKTGTITVEQLNSGETRKITIPNDLINIISVKVSGDYTLEDGTLKINDTILTSNQFELELPSNTFTISYLSDTESQATLSNVTYEITYKDNIASMIGVLDNSTLRNAINKGTIISDNMASGIVGILNNSNLINAYNNGLINSNGGLVYKVTGNSTLTNTYNTSNDSGLIEKVENAVLVINNSFNISSKPAINELDDSNITVTSSYVVNEDSNLFTKTTLENLKSKEFMSTIYNEFISSENLKDNPNNVWIYVDDNYPLLYSDDINNPFVNLHVKTYTFDSFSDELTKIKLEENITFSIENINELSNIDKYYYISNKKLTYSELSQISDWIQYENIVSITEEGAYIIYVKATDGVNTYYINSDLLILDLSGSDVNITLNDLNWTDLRNNLNYTYINKANKVTVTATDELSGVKSIEYYISSNIIDSSELDSVTWTNYDGEINLNTIGKYIVYVKVIDNSGYITYANTDYIIYNGYSLNISSGSHSNTDLNITNNSKMTLKFNYTGDDTITGKHYLVTNQLLPKGTIITLKTNNKIYEYVVDTTEDIFGYNDSCATNSCEKEASYAFTLFTEKNKTNIYEENSVIGTESIDIIIDFKSANIDENISVLKAYLKLQNNDLVRNTLEDNIKTFNIYVNKSANLSMSTNYNNDTLVYNSDSKLDISITSGVSYDYINSLKVFDTTYEDKKQGLAIKMVDSNGNILNSSYLKNIEFKVNEINYVPDTDSIVRIPISDSVGSVTKTLAIVTHNNSANLEAGNFYIEVSNFVSYDNTYYDELVNTIKIPVTIVNDNISNDYSFNVTMDDSKRIISKENTVIDFGINVKGLTNPTVRASLYKKDELTAYNQDYSLIDLNNYTVEDLENIGNNTYLANTTFSITLKTNELENTGYKFVFELYDGTKKVSSISKYFLVR